MREQPDTVLQRWHDRLGWLRLSDDERWAEVTRLTQENERWNATWADVVDQRDEAEAALLVCQQERDAALVDIQAIGEHHEAYARSYNTLGDQLEATYQAIAQLVDYLKLHAALIAEEGKSSSSDWQPGFACGYEAAAQRLAALLPAGGPQEKA